MLNTILVDTGPLVALFDKDDFYHTHIRSFMQGKRFRFLTTTAVMTEVLHLLDFHTSVQLDFLRWAISHGVALFEFQQKDLLRVVELTQKYSDRPMDFADASLVIAAEQTGIRQIISIDADFDIYRLPGKEHIRNLFRP